VPRRPLPPAHRVPPHDELVALRVNGDRGAILYLACYQRTANSGLDLALDVPPQRSCAVDRVVSLSGHHLPGRLGQLEPEPPVGQTRLHIRDLEIDDPLYLAHR